MYRIVAKSSVKKDLKKIKGTHLEAKFKKIIEQLQNDTFAPTQSFEKLVPPIKGFYSRRINVQHRVVYKVDETYKKVIIYSAWSHYE